MEKILSPRQTEDCLGDYYEMIVRRYFRSIPTSDDLEFILHDGRNLNISVRSKFGSIFIKVLRRNGDAGSGQHSDALIRRLESAACVFESADIRRVSRFPKILGTYRSETQGPAIVYEHLERHSSLGELIRKQEYFDDTRVGNIGELVAAIHSIPVLDSATAELPSWIGGEPFRKFPANTVPKLSAAQLSVWQNIIVSGTAGKIGMALGRHRDAGLRAPQFVVHGDLRTDQILIPSIVPEREPVLIDFETFGAGDRCFDIGWITGNLMFNSLIRKFQSEVPIAATAAAAPEDARALVAEALNYAQYLIAGFMTAYTASHPQLLSEEEVARSEFYLGAHLIDRALSHCSTRSVPHPVALAALGIGTFISLSDTPTILVPVTVPLVAPREAAK